MSKTTKLLPELRFPEFREDGEWKELPLGNFLYEHKVKSDGQCEVHSVSVHKGVINQKEHLGRSFAAKDTSNYNLAHPKDVIYTKSPTGHFAFGNVKQSHLEINVIVSPLYGVFTPITPEAGYIIHCFFESPQRALKYLDPITQKGAKNTIQITNQGFLSGLVRFPHSPAEQQKIADCLGSLDDLIAAHSRKLDALQDHKKGLLQQLFPAEGETTPELRFPEFEDSGEWNEVTLSEACQRIMDGTHFSPKTKSGPRLYLTSKNIQKGKIDLSRISYISNEEHQQIFKRCPVQLHDVLLTKDGAKTGNCALNNLDFEFSLLSSVAVLRTNPAILKSTFLYQSILSEKVQRLIQWAISGQAITRITLKKIGNFSISVPLPEEQQKIADCLSALDALITAQAEQIAALKAHKKGLMQQLFPVAN